MQTKTIRFWGLALVAISFSTAIGVRGAEEPSVLAVMEADQPYGVLRTVDGRMFVGVREARADETGLTFRHEGGAAKVPRAALSAADQRRFSVPAAEAPAAQPPAWASPDPASGSVTAAIPPLVFTYRVRAILPPAAAPETAGCASALSHYYWPSHWARPHYGMAYPLFPCRQLAERDFLITSGILPRPRGVWPWRLR
jgi:hypothetical protein